MQMYLPNRANNYIKEQIKIATKNSYQ